MHRSQGLPSLLISCIAVAAMAVVAVYLAFVITPYLDFLPSFSLGGGITSFTVAERYTVYVAFIVFLLLFFIPTRLVSARRQYQAPASNLIELYSHTAGYIAAVLYLFLWSDVAFITTLFGLIYLILVLLCACQSVVRIKAEGPSGIAGRVATVLFSGWTLLPILPGVVIVAVFGGYLLSADLRNQINEFKVAQIMGDASQWTLVPMCPEIAFNQPIDLKYVPDEPDSFFVLERPGRVVRVNRNCDTEVELDFSAKVSSVDVEGGALGLAIHPGFNSGEPDSGRNSIFVYYTTTLAESTVIRLAKYILVDDGASRVNTEDVLIEQQRDDSGFHNAGALFFDLAGYLFLSIGNLGDPETHQQVDKYLASGILRLDVDGSSGNSAAIARQPLAGRTQGYYIPRDNPFFGQPDALEEFWAVGLRNPFRASIDGATGYVWVGDVGSEKQEEISVLRAGSNGQYPIYEGTLRVRDDELPDLGIETKPVYTYRQTSVLRAVIGGFVYRHEKYPRLLGQYLFADNQAGFLFSIDAEAPADRETLAKTPYLGQNGITSISGSPQGEVIVTALGSKKKPNGLVAKLVAAEAATAAPVRMSSGHVSSEELYDMHCSRCHGLDGKGEGARALSDSAPDFTDPQWKSATSDQSIRDIIVGGGGVVGKSATMPAWGSMFSDEEMAELIAYIRAM